MNSENNITVTNNASNKVYQLMLEQENLNLKLRISIEGGGCNGFQYVFAFEEETQKNDTIITAVLSNNEGNNKSTICIIIDPISLQYLEGAKVDYKKDTQGERFIIQNPKAKRTCGCDRSFTT